MHYRKKKKNTGKTVLVAVIIILLVAAVATAAFFVINGSAPSFLENLISKPATPFVVEGEVRALSLSMPQEITDEDGLQNYFRSAAVFARENGFNTLVFEGKQGLSVYWKDKNFPMAAGITQNENTANTDPLSLLCKEANQQGIQVWLSIDPYVSGNYTSEMQGKAVSYAQEAGGNYFLPTDEKYAGYLEQSLAAMVKKYPVAGIVFTGIDNVMAYDNTAAESSFFAFDETLGKLRSSFPVVEGAKVSFALAFNDNGAVTPENVASLVSSGKLDYILPGILPGAALSQRLNVWAAAGGGPHLILTQQPEDSAATVLFAGRGSSAYSGALIAAYPAAASLGTRLALYTSALTPVEGELPTGFDIPKQLSITSPSQNAKIGWDVLFIMGTSNPAQPLLLDGAEVTGRSLNGAFGVLVELTVGTNTFTFTQGAETATLTVEKPAASTGGGTAVTQSDDTLEARPGQAVRVNSLIASALTDYTNDAAINETFQHGAVGIVQESVQTVRSSKKTWAYKLTSGDYVLARNCEFVTGGAAAFTGLSAAPDEKGEWLTFEGNGTPVSYVAFNGETSTLNLSFFDTSFTLAEGFQSELVRSASLTTNENGSVTLALGFGAGSLWGYSLEYVDGVTKLYLKKPPALSSDPAKPLTGVTVMLDPGHGDTDFGAPGLMGESGPNEKDVNLALAKTIAYRLRQLGATVTMTRENDSFPSLDDRLAMQMQEKPDFFLSVHHNALDSNRDLNETAGSQAYYYHIYDTPPTPAYAQNLLDAVSAATGRTGGEARWNYFYVTRATICPSVLFEYGFITNPAEFEDLFSTEGIWAAACGTAEGLLATLAPAVSAPPQEPAVPDSTPNSIPDGSVPQTA